MVSLTKVIDKSPAVEIRIATDADVPFIIPVINAAFSVVTFLSGSRTDESRMAELIRKGNFLIATQDESGTIVAAVYTEKRSNCGYLGMLAVEPSWQGTGLGRKMMAAAEQHCRRGRCKYTELSVLSPRTELLPFYRKLGYAETRTEEFHPTRPLKPGVECHCIIMSKEL